MKPYRPIQHLRALKKNEHTRIFFKKTLSGSTSKTKKANNSYFFESFFSSPSAFIRYKAYCAVAKKPRSVFRKFKISRIAFRELAAFGVINGLFKASW